MSIDWKRASPDELHVHLKDMDLEAFERACENEAFSEEHVRVLLKDPSLEPELVERISREARFFKRNSVRVALVLHAKLPRVRGLELVRYLFWRDQLRVATQPRIHPQVRVVAEQVLAERIPDLTVGERITIARTGSRAVLRALRSDKDPRVVEALLRNFRCTEEDAVFIAASSDTPPQVLATLARQPKWRQRREVRLQLVRNPRLAVPIALGLLEGLSQGELASVVQKGDLPKVLRESARRMIAALRRRGSRRTPSRW